MLLQNYEKENSVTFVYYCVFHHKQHSKEKKIFLETCKVLLNEQNQEGLPAWMSLC